MLHVNPESLKSGVFAIETHLFGLFSSQVLESCLPRSDSTAFPLCYFPVADHCYAQTAEVYSVSVWRPEV
jgi:hypothetical protein